MNANHFSVIVVAVASLTQACENKATPAREKTGGTGSATALETASSTPPARPSPAAPAKGGTSDKSAPSQSGAGPEQTAASETAISNKMQAQSGCPKGMTLVAGGTFWAGREHPGGNPEEHPRFQTQMHAFCMDTTEVTAAAYARCVASGECTPTKRQMTTCTQGRKGRENHPMNCVTWYQAKAYCKAQGARLPTELEWEYAARGGAELRKYSWGSEPPDGRTCWKRNKTCPVGSFEPGAFGLHDMNGNVWEWTDSYFGDYPWPARWSPHKVYRGGSWSRRFEKWMSLTLRNRYGPNNSGSHLGFRCVSLPVRVGCPYGRLGPDGKTEAQTYSTADYCRHGVEDMECKWGQQFNGARCARAGEPKCPDNKEFQPGYGCVVPGPVDKSLELGEITTEGVTAHRESRFDADCARYNTSKPKAWRFVGGSHEGRNLVGEQRGCKNRDVGVGWNSACCPK